MSFKLNIRSVISRLLVIPFLFLFLISCSSETMETQLIPSNPGDAAGQSGGSGGNTEGQTAPQSIDLSFCDNTLVIDHGRLCALKPSRTDANIKDYATGNPSTPGAGFGYHVLGIPKD